MQSVVQRSDAQFSTPWRRLVREVAALARPLDMLARSTRARSAYEVREVELSPALVGLCQEIMDHIRPHEVIDRIEPEASGGKPEVKPYLLRWHLRPKQTGRSEFALYLHHFLQPDGDVLHDHPWPSASWLLAGEQSELWKASGSMDGPPAHQSLAPGSQVLRPATHSHSLSLPRVGDEAWGPATTLFATGKRVRDWGFWPDQKFVPEAEYQLEKRTVRDPV